MESDRVAGVVSNSADALVVMLATVALGAIYTCASTDMGTKGILDRMLQVEPVWIFMDDAAVYNQKKIDLRPKVREIVSGMKDVAVFKGMVTLSRFAQPEDVSGISKT